MFRLVRIAAILASIAGGASALAAPVVIDFEAYSDTTALNNQIAGVTFSNATVISAGVTLNDLEFPPRSGNNVLLGLNRIFSPFMIDFQSPVSSVGAYFTYASMGLVLTAYDQNLVAIGSVSSLFFSNTALSGDVGSSPNEFLGIDYSLGISRITVTDPNNLQNNAFVLDDLTYDTAGVRVLPEPDSLAMLLSAIGIGAGLRRYRKQGNLKDQPNRR